MATIQLLFENQRNRQVLAEALAADHEVITGTESAEAFLDTDFDLCLLDGPAFRGQQDTLATRKERASPAFLPYLLFLGDRSPEQASKAVWELVDEVITAPIDREELTHRIANLLQRRDMSLELKRRQEFTEERFQTLFESTPDPIVVVTDEGIVTEVNDAFIRMFNRERETVVNEHVTDLDVSPSEAVERLLLRVDEAAGTAAGDPEGTVEVTSATGDTHVTELNVDVVEELGEATERIGIFRDVTGREEHQEALERQVKQLERFASVISHDLRDPLNTAIAKTRLIQRECESDKLDELIDVFDRMEALIEDVLTLAKQGKVVGETSPVELDTVAEAAWSTIDAPEEATLRFDTRVPMVDADEERLLALLENLFRNAVLHAGPDVTVEVGPLGGQFGFYVRDDGPGIPTAERDDVFEYGHTTAEEGTGIGLAIVKQIADAHGWDVALDESPAGGAQFEFVQR